MQGARFYAKYYPKLLFYSLSLEGGPRRQRVGVRVGQATPMFKRLHCDICKAKPGNLLQAQLLLQHSIN